MIAGSSSCLRRFRVFLELADAGEALVVVLLDAGALDVDLLLRLVGAVVLLEQLLHVHRGDVEFTLRARRRRRMQDAANAVLRKRRMSVMGW